MGTEIDPVNSSTGMEWISLVVVLLMVFSFFLVYKFLKTTYHESQPADRQAYRRRLFTHRKKASIKKALPINQKSF
jgi:hypothetical protein